MTNKKGATMNNEVTKTYDCFNGGLLVKHFVSYPEGTTLVHYTATKHNGTTSKKYTYIKHAINWLAK
jgi:hypothetical protein